MLVKAKLFRLLEHHGHTAGVGLVSQTHFAHSLHKIDIFTSLLLVLMGNQKKKKNHRQPKKQNWFPNGKISEKVSVKNCCIFVFCLGPCGGALCSVVIPCPKWRSLEINTINRVGSTFHFHFH